MAPQMAPWMEWKAKISGMDASALKRLKELEWKHPGRGCSSGMFREDAQKAGFQL